MLLPSMLLALIACTDDTTTDSTITDSATTDLGCAADGGCLIAQDLSAGLLSVRAVAADDVWIVGASPATDDGTGPVVLHYDGTAFERLDTSAWAGGELWWVWVTADEAVFVGHEGLILELDRATGDIAQVADVDTGITFFGVWGATGDDLWAVGQSDGGQGPAALWRRTAGTWDTFEDPDLGPGDDRQIFYKVHGVAADDLWIVGTNGRAMHWDGDGFTVVATDAETNTATAPLLTVDVAGENPVAVGGQGNGLILEYDGTDWLDKSPDFEAGYNGVCSGAGASWAVGIRGQRARREADGSWTSDRERGVDSWISRDWHGCTVDPDGGVWTVGGRIAARPLKEGAIGYEGTAELPAVSLD